MTPTPAAQPELTAQQLEQIIRVRRDLHEHPQAGYAETYASETITRLLTQWDVPFEAGVATTGVVAWLTPTDAQAAARPAVALRAGLLILVALIVKLATRERAPDDAAKGRGGDLEAGDRGGCGLGEPLLGEAPRVEPETEEDFQRAAAKDARFLAYKTAGAVLVFLVSTASQVFLAFKVGFFADKELLQENPRDLVTPVFLTSIVIVVNLEAMTFARLVDSVWQPRQYVCRKLHLHPLFYEPKHVAWSCKGCGKTLVQGFKVAFHCKQCDFSCCIHCYKKRKAEEQDTRAAQSKSQEADVTSWALFKLIMGLVATEIPLTATALVCVLGYAVVDNFIPDIQGKIFADFYPPGNVDVFKSHLIHYVYFLLASRVFNSVDQQSFQIVGLRLKTKLQKKLFIRILAQRTEYFDDAAVGDLTSRISREIPGMLQPCQRILPIVLSNTGALIMGLFFCFKYSWKLSLCCFATIPPIIFITRAYAKWSSKLWLQQYVGYGAANHIATETFSNIRTVHGFSTEEYESRKYGMKLDLMQKYGTLGAIGSGGSTFINGLLSMATNMLVLGYGGYLVLLWLHGEDTGMDAGKLYAYNLYVNKMQTAFTSLQSQINALTQATGAAQRVVGLMQTLPEDEPAGELEGMPQGTVEFRDVHFRYKAREDCEILRGLNLHIPGGSVCGIVGTSGAGKSTILSLLMQFYLPTSGSIWVEGQDLCTLDRRSVHRYMGIVTQDTQVFAASIEENIAYGVEHYSQEDLEAAAKLANAHEFISGFPEGYSTMVGDRGIRLSGGQKQRIAIARLLFRKPKVVLLDEATSALDAESEAQVQEALDNLIRLGGRTVIVVAHRLSTVKDADHIAVMDEGAVAEEGTHAELLSKQGIYAKLVSRQLESLAGVGPSS